MKILNILLLTILFIHIYYYASIGTYFTFELACFILLIWDYKLSGWNE